MELPDCPPGAEGYQDSVTEVPKKPEPDELACTKAELEFQDHLNGLKIRLDDGQTRCMVERRGRDVSGMWIYLCYPCAAVCSGESVLQTHISGKKHKIKLSMRNVWPKTIFDDHPFNQAANKSQPTEKVLQRMAEEVDIHNKSATELDLKYNKYREVTCHLQETIDAVKAPLIGVEYLVEHPPEQAHYEPSYICTLCTKQGHPRTIINHMTCFWHRYNYLVRHYSQACALLKPYRAQLKYREGVGVIMNRLSQRIEDKFGRKKPVHIDKEEYEKDRVQIHEWIFRSHHFSEKDGPTFTEVVDTGLIDSLHKSYEDIKNKAMGKDKRDPSPPIVAAPTRPLFNSFSDLTSFGQAAKGGAPARRGWRRIRNCRRSRVPQHVQSLRKQARVMNPFAVIFDTSGPTAPPAPTIMASNDKNTPSPPTITESFADDDPLYGCLMASPAPAELPESLGPKDDEPRWIPLHPIYSESFADVNMCFGV